MTDQSDQISYSASISTGTRQLGKENAVYAAKDVTAVTLPQGRVLLRNHDTGSQSVVDEILARGILGTVGYRPISAYVDRIAQTNSALATRRAAIADALHKLVDERILVSAEDTLQLWRPQVEGIKQTPLKTILVRTCDRPELLERLLTSIGSQTSISDKVYVVLDDSKYTAHQEANERIVESWSDSEGAQVFYHGIQAQTQVCEWLKSALPTSAKVIDWLLSPHREHPVSFGGGRLLNHALLLTAGGRAVVLDDDAVLSARHALSEVSKIVFSDAERGVTFFEDLEALEQRSTALPLDAVAEHERQLGLNLAQLLEGAREQSANAMLQGFPAHYAAGLSARSQAVLTLNGTMGDPGTASIDWVYQLESGSRERLIATEKRFMRLRFCRTMAMEYEALRINPDFGSMMFTTALGIDNRALLPPTSPEYRNEDLLFGALVRYIRPHDFILGLPFALLHLPEPERKWTEQALDRPLTNGLLGIMKDLSFNSMAVCHAIDAGDRIRHLSAAYIDIAHADDHDLRRGIEENLLRLQSRSAIRLSRRLEQATNAPQLWKEDVQRLLHSRSQAITHGIDNIFPELGQHMTADERVASFRNVLSSFGTALQHWPDIWGYAREQLEYTNSGLQSRRKFD